MPPKSGVAAVKSEGRIIHGEDLQGTQWGVRQWTRGDRELQVPAGKGLGQWSSGSPKGRKKEKPGGDSQEEENTVRGCVQGLGAQ